MEPHYIRSEKRGSLRNKYAVNVYKTYDAKGEASISAVEIEWVFLNVKKGYSNTHLDGGSDAPYFRETASGFWITAKFGQYYH